MRTQPPAAGRTTSAAATGYPWRCLCRAFGQITRTTPFRLTILHFAQMRLTEGRTFMEASFHPICNPSTAQIIR
jgi:hypothetical protein